MSGLRVPETGMIWQDGKLVSWSQAQVHMLNPAGTARE
jgi:hypothetical protein